MEAFHRIIEDICNEQNIKVEDYSYGWIKKLSKDDKSHFVVGMRFDINSITSALIAKDKYATYDILKKNNISIIEHNMIFNPSTRESYYENDILEETNQLLEKYGKVVIKANDSFAGRDVYLCESKEDIEKTIQDLFRDSKDTLSSQPFYDIKYEYRTVFLNGEIVYIYKKEKPYKIENGEKVYTSWKHNLSQGAIPIQIDSNENHYQEIIELAQNAGNAIGITFATVDIALTTDDQLYVMEVNGAVCLNKFVEMVPDGYNIAKDVYTRVVRLIF